MPDAMKPRVTQASLATKRVLVLSAAVALLHTLAACRMQEDASDKKPPPLASSTSHAKSGPRFVKGSADEVAAVVRRELATAKSEGREVLVYVGATWCEPCQRFHESAARGELDQAFPRLTLVEFDLDRDGERLRAAGYASQYIPLFALPSADGRGTGKQIEGSIKGEGAVAEMTPRLRGLLAR
jgi:thiol-disulfide isomerase/thioredoxin